MSTTVEVRGHHRVVFLITYRAALVLIAGVVLALVLGGWRLQVINHAAVRRSNIARCNAGNDFRAADLARWQYLLHIAPQRPDAPAVQRAQRAQFVAYIMKADKQVDCSKL